MNEKMRSCVMGLILGQFSSPLPEVQKEPVAYLYNGVRLPKLPEWDRERYPWAFIMSNPISDMCFLYVTEARPTYGKQGIIATYGIVLNGTSVRYKGYTSEANGEWEFLDNQDSPFYPGDSVVWSNTDILKADETVWFAASDPAPIYE